MDWETGIDIHTLLCIKQTTDENLLYITGNSTQCSVVTRMGRKSKKEGIFLYVQLSHFAVQQKLTQHCKATIFQKGLKKKKVYNASAFPGGASHKEPAYKYRRHKRNRFHPWVRKIPWRRQWQLAPVLLPGESHGRES